MSILAHCILSQGHPQHQQNLQHGNLVSVCQDQRSLGILSWYTIEKGLIESYRVTYIFPWESKSGQKVRTIIGKKAYVEVYIVVHIITGTTFLQSFV